MEALLRNIFLKYDSLPAAEKKKLISDINVVLNLDTIPNVKSVQSKTPKKGKYETVTQLVEKPDLMLFETLRLWRNKVAKDLDLQPWLVFDNKTITNIAFYKPATVEDLLKINGIGPEKAGKYSEAIIELVTLKNTTTSSRKETTSNNITEDEAEPFEQPVIRRRLQSNK